MARFARKGSTVFHAYGCRLFVAFFIFVFSSSHLLSSIHLHRQTSVTATCTRSVPFECVVCSHFTSTHSTLSARHSDITPLQPRTPTTSLRKFLRASSTTIFFTDHLQRAQTAPGCRHRSAQSSACAVLAIIGLIYYHFPSPLPSLRAKAQKRVARSGSGLLAAVRSIHCCNAFIFRRGGVV